MKKKNEESIRFNLVLLDSWSSSEAQWTKVGDVVGAAGQSESTKNFYEGKEYDYVFSVDIAEGQPPLKLPYNTSEDPWSAAQKFIHDHELSQQYLDTVANFIITNSKGSSGGESMEVSNRPAASSAAQFGDPLTGGSRYVPRQSNPVSDSGPYSGDPFTGSGRYIAGSNSTPAPAPSNYFPVRDFLRFDQANIEAISSNYPHFFKNF